MSDLVRFYREYYREQTVSSFEDLFRCMKDYDFSTYQEDMRRVFAMHQQAKCVGSSRTLTSGGSTTGFGSNYQFGPNFRIVKVALEGFLRLSHKKTILIAKSDGLNEPRLLEEPNPPQYDLQVIGDWTLPGHLEFLFDVVGDIHSEFGSVNLCALPCVWLGLTCDPNFVKRAESNVHKINALVNTDNIACFRSVACPTRDQMIDWKSGVNFYTCSSGRRHFLPTFFCFSPSISYSLVNLKKSTSDCDDVVAIERNSDFCSCGLPATFMSFVPHEKNYPINRDGEYLRPQEVVDLLPDYVDWLQVLQDSWGEFCTVFCHSRYEDADFSRLTTHLENFGIGKIGLDYSRYLSLGRKRPLLWRGGNPQFHSRSIK